MIPSLLIISIINNINEYYDGILNINYINKNFNNIDLKIIIINTDINIDILPNNMFTIVNSNKNIIDQINNIILKYYKYNYCFIFNPHVLLYNELLSNIFINIIRTNSISLNGNKYLVPNKVSNININYQNHYNFINHDWLINRTIILKIELFRKIQFEIKYNNIDICIDKWIYILKNNGYSSMNNIQNLYLNNNIYKYNQLEPIYNNNYLESNYKICMSNFGYWGFANQMFQYSFLYIA